MHNDDQMRSLWGISESIQYTYTYYTYILQYLFEKAVFKLIEEKHIYLYRIQTHAIGTSSILSHIRDVISYKGKL